MYFRTGNSITVLNLTIRWIEMEALKIYLSFMQDTYRKDCLYHCKNFNTSVLISKITYTLVKYWCTSTIKNKNTLAEPARLLIADGCIT